MYPIFRIGLNRVSSFLTGTFLRRVGCEGITNFPNGIDISDAGDVLIGDSHGNRFHVAVYRKNGDLMCEFECPYAKVRKHTLIVWNRIGSGFFVDQ